MSESLSHRQVIQDQELMGQYSAILCNAYDELYELDLTRELIRTVFYTDKKHKILQKSGFSPLYFPDIADQLVHPDDRQAFLRFFDLDRLVKQFDQKEKSRQIEYRMKMDQNEGYEWVEATTLPMNQDENLIMICYIRDIHAKKEAELQNEALTKVNRTLSENFFLSFGRLYLSITQVDLATGEAIILKNHDSKYEQGMVFRWTDLLDNYCKDRVNENDRNIVYREFTEKNLKNMVESGQGLKTVEVRCMAGGANYEWTELAAFSAVGTEPDRLFLTTRSVHTERLLKGIVDRFVYRNCDYFIYLNGLHDSYVMFSGSDNGSPLPPTVGDNYSEELERFAKSYVAEEDIDMVIREMQLERVIQVLEQQEEHTFTCGLNDPVRGYTRKLVQYIYYDRDNCMILLTRTDITAIYLAEKKQQDLLMDAMQQAQTDPLTGLYNKKAGESMISQILSENSGIHGALLFLDLDNFKMVNDSLGHLNGDKLLCSAAQQFLKNVGPDDLVARVGGDEFLIFLSDTGDQQKIIDCAQRLCRSFEELPEELKALNLSCSIGISRCPQNGDTYLELAGKADKALYQAKEQGKNQFTFY